MKAKELVGQQFGNWLILKRDFSKNNGRSNWLCECQCEAKTQRVVDGYSLTSGHSTSCGCLKGHSKGEDKISQILKENNIPFTRQKSFDNCRFPKTNRLALFDFWVNNSYLIEYDGDQHTVLGYGYMNSSERLKETQEHDQFKTEWCQQNNIPLIRISYLQFNNLTIEDLIIH